MSAILSIILVIEIVFTIFISMKATAKFDCTYSLFGITRHTCKYFASLFENRNAFGTVLSAIVCIISIPSIIFIILSDIIVFLLIFCKKIWELGFKK